MKRRKRGSRGKGGSVNSVPAMQSSPMSQETWSMWASLRACVSGEWSLRRVVWVGFITLGGMIGGVVCVVGVALFWLILTDGGGQTARGTTPRIDRQLVIPLLVALLVVAVVAGVGYLLADKWGLIVALTIFGVVVGGFFGFIGSAGHTVPEGPEKGTDADLHVAAPSADSQTL